MPARGSPSWSARLAAPAAAMAAVLFAGAAPAQEPTYEQLQTFSGVLSQVRLWYVDTVTTRHLVRGAIAGMLGSLDPHSHFEDREIAERIAAWRAGHLAMTGIFVDVVDGAVTVRSVYPRSPAAEAGVAAGDRILAIADSSVAGLDPSAVQARLVGPPGTRVRILLERGSRYEPESLRVRVRNERIQPRSVAIARTLPSGVGYVRLNEFLPESGREVRDAIARVARRGPRRLILDLRGNGGGAVQAAVDVAALFFPKGVLIFGTRGRRRDVTELFHAPDDGECRDVALVVLVNEGTASAAEIVAGAIQDHDRGVIAGRRTFGKALVQRSLEVPPAGDVVWLTIAYAHTPSGRIIQRPYHGVTTAAYRNPSGPTAAEADTANGYRTDGGRLIHGGGGIRPDTVLPGPPATPPWWGVAVDSGFTIAVADSVAGAMPEERAARDRWVSTPEDWGPRLVGPLMDRVRARLGVRGDPPDAVAARIAFTLAGRVAEVRWGEEALLDLIVRNDPDIAAADRLAAQTGALLRRAPP